MRHSLASLVALLVVLAAGAAIAADHPNILWLTSEDHGPEMGCYGDANARTPNVDALAARGMLFKRAWSTAPVCAAARSAIICGVYPCSSGGEHMRSMVPLPAEIKMYPQFLHEAGYYCTNHTKEDYNLRAPKHLWDDTSASAHWRNRAAGQPFFAVFNSTKSHESQIRGKPKVSDPAKMRVPAYHPDVPETRDNWAAYYDQVGAADADAGKLLQEINEAGLADDTIVFYYADHGSGMPRSKRWPCNSGLHVPMVVYFPQKWRHLAPKEYEPGAKSDRMVGFVDLAPTLLSIVGVKPPAWMQGHAFAGPFQAEPQPYLFGERGRMDERMDLVRSVTDGRYVYLRNYFPHVSQGQHIAYQFQTPTTRVWRELFDQGKTNEAQSIFWRVPKAPEELYDLQADRDEVHNLARVPDHRDVLERLRKAHRDHIFEIRDVCFLPEGEIHSRSAGSTPYELARDDAKYPLKRIVAAADLASNLDPGALGELKTLLTDDDSAVRYWAALGYLMRGQAAVTQGEQPMRDALKDSSPYVRIVAAQALGLYGPQDACDRAIAVLKELAPPETNGVFVAMSALSAIEALGKKGASLRDVVGGLNPRGPSPDARYNEYVPRLIENITGKKRPEKAAGPKGEGKGKGKVEGKGA